MNRHKIPDPQGTVAKIERQARQALEEFTMRHTVRANCLLVGGDVAELLAAACCMLPPAEAEKILTQRPDIRGQTCFIGLPVVLVARPGLIGAGLMHPAECFDNPNARPVTVHQPTPPTA